MSDIRVSVQWKTSTVFAGEDVECKITFKNVSQSGRSPSPDSHIRNSGTHRERWRETLPSHPLQNGADPSSRQPTPVARFSQANHRTHKSTLSLSAQNGMRQASFPEAKGSMVRGSVLGDSQHRRSVSIVSIGGDGIQETTVHTQPSSFRRPGHGHARAASLQVLPKRNGLSSPGPTSGKSLKPNAYVCAEIQHSTWERSRIHRTVSSVSSLKYAFGTRLKRACLVAIKKPHQTGY